MIKIGKYNRLNVSRHSEYGAYLIDKESGKEVLLPARYCSPMPEIGTRMRVFVYNDSEDRPVATTETPYATVGEFAFLQAVDSSRVGTFLDWGLPKNLLCPFSEQRARMHGGGVYLVYVFLDHVTKRVAASAKIEKYLGNVPPEYKRGNKVDCLVIEHVPELGYRVIVDNLHRGMIYENELFRPLEVQQTVQAYVKNIRDDGKIDLTLTAPSTEGRIHSLESTILKHLQAGTLGLSEASSPEEIKQRLQCSKRDFKKTLGALYRQRRIIIAPDGTISINKSQS